MKTLGLILILFFTQNSFAYHDEIKSGSEMKFACQKAYGKIYQKRKYNRHLQNASNDLLYGYNDQQIAIAAGIPIGIVAATAFSIAVPSYMPLMIMAGAGAGAIGGTAVLIAGKVIVPLVTRADYLVKLALTSATIRANRALYISQLTEEERVEYLKKIPFDPMEKLTRQINNRGIKVSYQDVKNKLGKLSKTSDVFCKKGKLMNLRNVRRLLVKEFKKQD